MTYQLGRKPTRFDPRTLKLGDYLAPQIVPPPARDWSQKVKQWGMLANDEIGDCVLAAAAHQEMLWTAYAGTPFVPTTEQVVADYSALTGYDPADPSTDQGAVELDALNYWRRHGVAGHKILAYASVKPHIRSQVMSAIWIFGGLFIGLDLPISAQGQKAWEVTGSTGNAEPGSWGGHAVICCSYDQDYVTCITWGAPLKMSWPFFLAYTEEAYAIISPDFIRANGISPSGFHLATLQTDLKLVTA